MWDVLSGVAKMAWDFMSGVTKTAWDVMSRATKTAWDVLSGMANLCGMFCPGCQKMAWDVLWRDVLSGSHQRHSPSILFIYTIVSDKPNVHHLLSHPFVSPYCKQSGFIVFISMIKSSLKCT